MADPPGEWWATLPGRLAPASPAWSTPAFAAELRDWCQDAIGSPVEAHEVKLRGWSTVWRVESATGVWWAKENCPRQAFEAALLPELARLAPQRMVPVTAADAGRGRLLTPDQGPTLRSSGAADVAVWSRMLVAAAGLQRELLPHGDRLVATGLTPLTDPSGYAAARLEQLAALPEGDPRRLAPTDAARVRAALPDVRRWADEVAALGLPAALDHNDLHDANVFVSGEGGEERIRFFDLGDALLTDPLLALTVPLGVLADQLGAGPGDPRVARVAEAALEVWSDLAPLTDLRAALPAALRLGCLGRVESWLRVQASFTFAELAELGPAAGAWLLRTLDAPSL